MSEGGRRGWGGYIRIAEEDPCLFGLKAGLKGAEVVAGAGSRRRVTVPVCACILGWI